MTTCLVAQKVTSMRETPAPPPNSTSTPAEPVSFLAAAAALAAIDDAVRTAQSPAPAETAGHSTEGDPEPALAALILLREVRAELAGWEAGLVENARAAGATWADLAQPMGVASRQAAENRYLRLRPAPTTLQTTVTGAERVKAVRDRRAADRTVTAWARTNAVDLRVLAAQLTALTDLAPEPAPPRTPCTPPLPQPMPPTSSRLWPPCVPTSAPATPTSPPASTTSPATPTSSAMTATADAPDPTPDEARWPYIQDRLAQVRHRAHAETSEAIASSTPAWPNSTPCAANSPTTPGALRPGHRRSRPIPGQDAASGSRQGCEGGPPGQTHACDLFTPVDDARDFGAHGRFDDRTRERSVQQQAVHAFGALTDRVRRAVDEWGRACPLPLPGVFRGCGVDAPATIGEEGVTMPRGSSPKRERQYEHIKDSAKERGESEKRAKEIAARTVNKERAWHGESKTASRSSVKDTSSSKRGGQRSHSGSQGSTKEQLFNEDTQRNIHGRSTMNKKQLADVLGHGPLR